MRVLYVVTDLAMGGAEIQVLRMIKYLRKEMNDITYLSMLPASDESMLSTLKDNGVDFMSLNMSPGKASISNLLQFIKIVKQQKPDVIHAHMIHANLLTRAAAPFIKVNKIINTIHGEEEFIGKRKWVYRLTDCLANYTVCCGSSLYKQAMQDKIVSQKRLRVIQNGLDLGDYSSSRLKRLEYRKRFDVDEQEFIWMTVGRLEKVKNYCYLVEEFCDLCKQYNEIRLFFVGDGQEYGNLAKQVKEKGIENKVVFCGKRNDVVELLNMSDAFVLSSLHEGLPLSLQEAAAMSKPLVCTNVGGCCEVVHEKVNGFLCNVNETGGLRNAMEQVMKLSYKDYMEYSNASRKIVELNFGITYTMEAWINLYIM